MRSLNTYIQILKKKGFKYSFHEAWKKMCRLRWIRNNNVLELEDEYRAYRYLERYKYTLSQVSAENAENVNLFPDKIWVCWLQGVENAPELVKRCIKSIQINSGGKEVIILTLQNLDKYLSLPTYIEEKYRRKIIPNAHYSDIIRIALLAQYGGIWIDATVLLTEQLPEYITESPLFCFKSSFLSPSRIKASSWFIAAQHGNDIVCQVRNILYEYWGRENFLRHYYTFHLFFAMIIDSNSENKKLWEEIPYYNNITPHVLGTEMFKQFTEQRFKEICKYAPMQKLTYKMQKDKLENIKGTFYERLIVMDSPFDEEM